MGGHLVEWLLVTGLVLLLGARLVVGLLTVRVVLMLLLLGLLVGLVRHSLVYYGGLVCAVNGDLESAITVLAWHKWLLGLVPLIALLFCL